MSVTALHLPAHLTPDSHLPKQEASATNVAQTAKAAQGDIGVCAQTKYPVFDPDEIRQDIERRQLQSLLQSMMKLERLRDESLDTALRARLTTHMAETLGLAWENIRPLLIAAAGMPPQDKGPATRPRD